MRGWWVIALTAMVVGCSGETNDERASAQHGSADVTRTWPVRPRDSANIFYSGHSLMDRPLPDFVEKIAHSLAMQAHWNRQYVVGSSIQRRTQGAEPIVPGWRGYREGYNRDGEGLDVVAELKTPQTIVEPYDVLVITEEHTMLDRLMLSDTVRLLRHYHDRFIAGNATGRTYFYQPWLDVENKANPKSWIEYERAAAPVWECAATRVNVSLEHEGRADRIVSLPASLALAALIEHATEGNGLPAISRGSVQETVNTIFKDDVHLQVLGIYYVSLVTYAATYERSPQGAWHPEDIGREQAEALQRFAWSFVSDYYEVYRPLSLQQCRALLLSGAGLAPLWGYVRDTVWRKNDGTLHSYARYVRRLSNSRRIFAAESAENPFYFDPATDGQYWLPAP